MRAIKLFSLLIFLFAVSGGRAHAPVSHKEKKAGINPAGKHIACKVAPEREDEDSPLRKKRKTRGIEVDVLHIHTIFLVQNFTHRSHRIVTLGKCYSSFLYCVGPKRGPPFVS